MMRIPAKAALVLAAASLLGACTQTTAVASRDPNPAPPPGYRVECANIPAPLYNYFAHCTPVQERSVAVQAKG